MIALGFASSERAAGRGGQAGVSAPASIPGDPRHLGLGKTSTVRAAGRNQALVGRLEAREAIRSRAGPVDDRRCSASIRVGLWRHRAQADSELSGRCGRRLRTPAGWLQKSSSVPCRSQSRYPVEAAKSAEMASFVRGMVDRSVCPCSVKNGCRSRQAALGPRSRSRSRLRAVGRV